MRAGINFHNTFPPDVNYLSRLLSYADGISRSPETISQMTGVPQGKSTGKVNPHLYYLMLMGLLEDDRATLTSLGQLVRSEDPSCQEPITQWLMHANLTSINGADMWHYVYRELLPENGGSVSQSFLETNMAARYGAQTRYAVITSCYTKGLTTLDYISVTDESVAISAQKVHREYLYLYAYELLREWAAIYQEALEITADQLFAMNSASCFGLTREQWFDILEQLNSRGIIRLNRQLTPFTAIRNVSCDAIEQKLYSLLI